MCWFIGSFPLPPLEPWAPLAPDSHSQPADPPPSHPERLSDTPLTETERQLWQQLKTLREAPCE
jgi:hypothetical protein